MCGRAAQTKQSALEVARKFEASSSCPSGDSASKHNVEFHQDNFNMSPGMDAMVMYMENGQLHMNRKKWGLITKSGSSKKPLYSSDKDIIKLCFSNLCFNARSDTLFAKPTFSRLAFRKMSCIVAMDGYFEWKLSPLSKRKQPYFVYRSTSSSTETDEKRIQPLLMAGLWTRVSTGREDTPTMDSFTILTTEACPQISWLHDRMPICVWDEELARQWLISPSESLEKRLDDIARKQTDVFGWHKVTPEMSKLQFRGKEAVAPIKETTQSVKNFFAAAPMKSKNSKTVSNADFDRSRSMAIKGAMPDSEEKRNKATSKEIPSILEKRRLESPGTASTTSKEATSIGSSCQGTSPNTQIATRNKKAKTMKSQSPGSNKNQHSIISFLEQKR